MYCDFYSIERVEQTSVFLRALAREIDLVADRHHASSTFHTLFFGGGTPSLLEPHRLGAIIEQLRGRFTIAPDAEITVECNPGTVDRAKLEGYRALGVNRLSFGVQSFLQDELEFLGRIHDADQARAGVRAAREAGFDNISIDLIFALPLHTPERWAHTLREAVALNPEHISAYSLIYEEGTPLYAQKEKGLVTPIDEDLDADMYLFTGSFLADHGYHQYEVSNYARPADRSATRASAQRGVPLHSCRHNLNYWHRGEYLSFGPSAHSFWDGERRWNVSSLTTYLESLDREALPLAGGERLTTEQALTETVSLGLRSDGIRLQHVTDLFKFDFLAANRARLAEFVEAGLLVVENDIVRCTPKGYLSCDALTLELLN